jgi:hypothetical protein
MIEYAETQKQIFSMYFPDYMCFVDTSVNSDDIQTFYQAQGKSFLFCACKHREGSDIPYLDGCIFLDKVEDRSPKTFIQCMGRVLRKDPLNQKSFGLVLDLKASSSMDIINRIHPFLSMDGTHIFPWQTTSSSHPSFSIKQLLMVNPKVTEPKATDPTVDGPNVSEPKATDPKVTDPQAYKTDESIHITHPNSNSTIQDLISLFIRPIPNELYQQRLDHELDLLKQKNLIPYILQALNVLKLTGSMIHVTRGSCGSSLVCYLLGISHVDPVKYNISFARFLNIHRSTLPDIDYDFPYHLRNDVFVALEERYPGKIARISNHVYYHDKSALREAIRKEGIRQFIPKFEVMKVVSEMDMGIQEKIMKTKKDLEGTFKCYSLHCGGIIYYPDGVPQNKVLHKDSSTILSQVTMNKEEVAKEKHFKIDILSSRGLAIIHDLSQLHDPPTFDPKVFEMLCQGDNIGVTLAESPLMRKTFLKFQPKTIEDLALCLSIIRPAAKDARDAEVDDLSEEEIQELLSSKIIYDDDAIKYISTLLNCSEDDGDKFRRIFAKGDKKGIEEFKSLCSDETAIKVLKRLTKYSFCKAHAFSYAQLVYDLAFYKLHHPVDFWKAVLKHSQSSYKKWVHIYHARLYQVSKTVKDVSIYAENRRSKIDGLETPLAQMRKFGYWVMVTDDFFPGSYFYQVTDTSFCFCGLIASMKKLSHQIILYLGVEKNLYIEVIIQDEDFIHSKWIGCKGTAKVVSDSQKVYEATKYNFF